jgi:CubicO group peptidase (beta-lactamase class C family)
MVSAVDPSARAEAGPPKEPSPPRWGWDRGPWNRWTFQHMREMVPTAEVWRGNGHRRRLERAERDLDGLPVNDVAGSPTTLAALLDETYTDAILVLKDGAVAYERYFGGMDERTLHLSQSVAKSVTGAVAGILVGRGLLDPARPIADYLPELSETGWRGATLQHVLDMTTGVKFDETYTNPYSEMGMLDVACGWNPPPPGSDPSFDWPANVWELITRLKETTRPHGEAFEYRSIETDVLAFAMERVSGKRLPQLVSEELWQKLGADESACFTVDRAGYALADGGFNATLRDYARFGQLILDNGGGIVPAAWIETTRNNAVHRPGFALPIPEGAYHNQFWIEDPRSKTLMCRGVFGQLIWISFAHRMVVMKLSSWPDFYNIDISVATLKAIHRIAAELK